MYFQRFASVVCITTVLLNPNLHAKYVLVSLEHEIPDVAPEESSQVFAHKGYRRE